MVLRELKLGHRLEDFLHISLHKFHHDEDGSHVVLALWLDDVEDLGGEGVVLHLSELPEDLDLTDNFLGVVLALEDVVDELDGDLFTGIPMFGLNNLTIATLTNELDELIVLEGVSPYWGKGDHVGLLGLGAAATGLSGLVTHCVVDALFLDKIITN